MLRYDTYQAQCAIFVPASEACSEIKVVSVVLFFSRIRRNLSFYSYDDKEGECQVLAARCSSVGNIIPQRRARFDYSWRCTYSLQYNTHNVFSGRGGEGLLRIEEKVGRV